MRLYLKLYAKDCVIPFEHQHLLVGCIHKWLGWNDLHGELSLFSFSRLSGGRLKDNGLFFEKSGAFFVSAFDPEMIRKILQGVRQDPTMFLGLTVSEVSIIDKPDLLDKEYFLLGSPILIKRRGENGIEHVTYTNTNASKYLKETLLTKMKKAGISDEAFDICFDHSFHKAKTMLIKYRGVENKANWCPVVIKGSLEVKQFIWCIGLGNSTGIGFGAIL